MLEISEAALRMEITPYHYVPILPTRTPLQPARPPSPCFSPAVSEARSIPPVVDIATSLRVDQLENQCDTLTTRCNELSAHCNKLSQHCNQLSTRGNELTRRCQQLAAAAADTKGSSSQAPPVQVAGVSSQELDTVSTKLKAHCDQAMHNMARQYQSQCQALKLRGDQALAQATAQHQARYAELKTRCDQLVDTCENLRVRTQQVCAAKFDEAQLWQQCDQILANKFQAQEAHMLQEMQTLQHSMDKLAHEHTTFTKWQSKVAKHLLQPTPPPYVSLTVPDTPRTFKLGSGGVQSHAQQFVWLCLLLLWCYCKLGSSFEFQPF